MVRWLRWHCPPDTGFEIRALAVWGRARYLSVTEAPHNTNFHTWMGKKQFCFFQTAETRNRTPDSGVKGSGANHYPGAPARKHQQGKDNQLIPFSLVSINHQAITTFTDLPMGRPRICSIEGRAKRKRLVSWLRTCNSRRYNTWSAITTIIIQCCHYNLVL